MTTDDAEFGPTGPKLQDNWLVQLPLVGAADTTSTPESAHPKHVVTGPSTVTFRVVAIGGVNNHQEFVVTVACMSNVSPTATVIGAVLATVTVALGNPGREVVGGGNVGGATLTDPSTPTVKAVVGVAVEPAEFSAMMRS